MAQSAATTPWLATFTLLVFAQSAHLLEHVAQIFQIHVLGLAGPDARGIVGQLDVEWVHFIWNGAVVVTLGALLLHDRSNRWLVLATAFASWHLVEHDFIMRTFLATGIPGSPGLLATGGLIAGGLPPSPPDLPFLHHLVETAAVVVAYLSQLRMDGARAPSLELQHA